MPEAMTVSAERVRRQITAVLLAWGMAQDLAETTAEVMVETDLMGVDSHGISMLMLYERMRTAGQLRLQARPRVVRDAACTALVDGGAGLGHPVAVMAMTLAVDKALAAGASARWACSTRTTSARRATTRAWPRTAACWAWSPARPAPW